MIESSFIRVDGPLGRSEYVRLQYEQVYKALLEAYEAGLSAADINSRLFRQTSLMISRNHDNPGALLAVSTAMIGAAVFNEHLHVCDGNLYVCMRTLADTMKRQADQVGS